MKRGTRRCRQCARKALAVTHVVRHARPGVDPRYVTVVLCLHCDTNQHRPAS